MNKSKFCSRIYVYVSYDPEQSNSPCQVNMTNAAGTSIGGGYLENQSEVADCLSAMGCPPERLPHPMQRDDLVRVMSNVRPRDLDSALALLD
jgi:hypothetical protein